MSTFGREADAAAARQRRRRKWLQPKNEAREQLAVWRCDLEQRLWRAQLRAACGASHIDFAALAEEVTAFAHCLDMLASEQEALAA